MAAEAVVDVARHRVSLLLCVVCCCGIFCIQPVPTHEYVGFWGRSVTAKIEYIVKSILRTCLYIKSILHEIITM